ncbi:DNA cytosine methyltransferase [Devosia sp. FJ2-5-3]|uniref:DNA cytosine methyltransferase n=1 Tax=Devosia sp. FJ2-5-3 TaxID=2976680 RepID=UPI0023D82193|nr:DNA cytosine methyltransferase [Devosia sp. FJ2-5-3]WEJ60207.1 DNA cytosine methyltransferase [Devosia sp. FJ2-5-3]
MNAQLPPSFWQFEQASPDSDELIIDSFAGGGGASTGIEMALGRSPDYAINHDPEALALHRANHPDTVHLSKNIYKVDPMDVVGRRKVGLLWASPDCKHFSKAKGGKPVKREIRDLAWTVVLWAERVRPRVIILENVEEFQTWGPLIETEKGIFPCPDRKGETFKEWIGALKKHGYKVEWKELRACDFGAPTTRKRLFLIARCDGKPIVWPEPTHGAGRLPYHTAASHVIDWSIPCPSIFDTSEEIMAKFGVRAIRPLAENTLARIAKGVKRYVLDAAKPFVIKFQTGAVGSDIDQPLPTVTANSFIKRPGGAAPLGIVTPHLMTMRNAGKPHNEADKPTHTVTAGGAGLSLMAPVLSAAQQGGSNRAADEPVHTITASPKDQNQILAATMVQTGYGEREGQEPRVLDVEAPLGTVVAGGVKHAAVAAFLAQHNNDRKPSGGVYPKPGRPATEPLSTLTVTGSQQAVVSAGLMNMKGECRSSLPIEGQTPTQTAGGEHIAEVRAFLMKYYGVDQDPRLEEPLSTVTTKDRFGIVTVEGVDYEIVDIGMRMLTPRELFKAQGFPADYEIETGVFDGGERRPLTRTAQVRMCGNSVCPPIAAALVSANCADLAAVAREAAE